MSGVRSWGGALIDVGLDPSANGSLSAGILRRPAPAYRHRARHGAGSRNSCFWTSRPRRSTMSVQAQIVELLRETARPSANWPYMFISHDLKVVRALANHVIVMQNGRVVRTRRRGPCLRRA